MRPILNVFLLLPPLLTFTLIEWGSVSAILLFYKNGIAQLVIIHLIWLILMGSFIQVMRINPGKVSRDPSVTYLVRYDNGEQRFCEKCNFIKPDRAHDCYICNTCVLKMDHHCPWIYNCVGYYTHKLFILFTFYGFLYCLCLFASFLQLYPTVKTTDVSYSMELNLFMSIVASGLFAVALLLFSSLHISYAIRNLTSMEVMGFRTRFTTRRNLNIFRKSAMDNLKLVMGEDVLWWWFPSIPKFKHDGYEFELNEEANRLLHVEAV